MFLFHWSIEDILLIFLCLFFFSGNLRGAVACFERAIFINAEEVEHHQGLLKCLIGLGQLNNASMNVAGIIESKLV